MAGAAGWRGWSGLLERPDVLVLDTETTGTGPRDEVLSLGVIDTTGATRYRALVLPEVAVRPAAARMHGLTRERLQGLGARPWPRHHDAVAALLGGAARVLAYNCEFDRRLLQQTAGRYGLSAPAASWRCLMLDYAELRAEPHPDRAGEYRWHRLTAAAAHEGVRGLSRAHDALADCRIALGLMRAVAAGRSKVRRLPERRRSRDSPLRL